MNGFEWNKIFAAVLVAGLVMMLGGFFAGQLVHSPKLEKPAYVVEGVESADAPAMADAPKALTPISPLLATADAAAGQKVARACAACHSFEKGGANKVGPNLYGIVGNVHAHAEGFSYSPGMTALHGKNWDYEALNEFLHDPKATVKGTKMAFAGVKNDSDRANLIAFLRTLADSPVALPK